jgi:serine/threonine-protein kinase RsbW
MTEQEHVIRLAIPADLDEIPRVSEVIEENLQTAGFPEETILDLQLAVEEAVANTVVHGYRGAAGEVIIAVQITDDAVQVRIEDNAPPFNPLSVPDPDRGTDLEDRRIGGVGIFLIRQVMDEVSYEYKDGKNLLTLVKQKKG